MKKQRNFRLVRDNEGFHGPKGQFVGHEGELSDEGLVKLIEDNLKAETPEDIKLKNYVLMQIRKRLVDLRNHIDEMKEDDIEIKQLRPRTN